MRNMLVAGLFVALVPSAHADQGIITNTGSTTNPAGVLGIGTTTVSYVSADGSIVISAAITASASSESCYGGGKGGHITCYTTLSGSFSGTLVSNGGPSEAINGSIYQSGVAGGTQSGSISYHSAYTPFYYSDSEQILRADDLQGTHQIAYGSQGSGVGNFYGANGIAVDGSGRILVADTYNCRVVRIDDMNGTNWTEFGTCGSGQGQFQDPGAVAVDTAGAIYVMDTGNSRLVRMDDLAGTHWTSFGSPGSGVGQFASFTSVALDASKRIYVADGGNRRIVRMDDMTGANWTVLTQSPQIGVYIYQFANPVAVALDPAGRIYVVDAAYYAPELIRVDDMAGTNWTSLYIGPAGGGAPNSIAIDSSGIVFTGGGGVKIVDGMAGVLNSSGSIAPLGTYYVFGVTPVPLAPPPASRPSAIRLSPDALSFSQYVGTSASLPVTITNIGGTSLNLSSVSANGGFTETDDCAGQRLAGGSSCTVTVTYWPMAAGPASGSLVVVDDSGNAGPAQAVSLAGSASVAPDPIFSDGFESLQ